MALRFAIFLYLLIAALPADAQFLSQERRIAMPASIQSVSHLLTDGYGMLWLAGSEGLVAFDGSETTSHALIDHNVTAAAAGGDRLWAGTAAGRLYTLQAGNGHVLDSMQLCDTAIVHLQSTSIGLLAGTEGAGAFLLGASDTLHIDRSMLQDAAVHGSAYEPSSRRLFLATDAGLEVFQIEPSGLAARPVHFIPLPLAGSMHLLENTLLVSDYRKQWFQVSLSANMADWKALPYLIDTATSGTSPSRMGMQARSLLPSVTGLYLQGNSPGETMQLTPHTDYEALCLSDEGLAIALRPGGILEYHDLRFYNWASPRMPTAITALRVDNDTLAITSEGLLRLVELSTGRQRDYDLPAGSVVVDMAWQGGTLYLGCFNQGVLAITPPHSKVKVIAENQGLPDNNVLAIATQGDSLWISTLGGLSVLTKEGKVLSVSAPEAAGATYTYALKSTPQGMAIGTDGRGAYILHKGSWQGLMPDSLADVASVYQLLPAGHDSLYLITKSSGIFRLSMPDFNLQALPQAFAKEGFYAHGAGPKGSLLRNADGRLEWLAGRDYLSFGESQSLAWNGSLYFHTIAPYGEALSFVAKDQEVVIFNRQAVLKLSPQPFVTAMEVDLMPHVLSQNDLGSGSKRLSFHFNAVWQQAPADLNFSYKLEGADGNWQHTSERRAVYSSLGPGRYTFLLQAHVGDGAYAQPATLRHEFVITAPLYQRWWFIALVGLLAILVIYGTFKLRIAALNRRRLAERREVEGRLQHLRDQVNPHFLFNSFNTLLTMVETQPKAAADYVQRLSDFYRKVLEQDSRAWHTLEEELTMLGDYVYLQQMRFGKALALEINIEQVFKGFLIPALALQLLAENAVKHNRISQKETLVISIFVENETLVVRNNKIAKREVASGTRTGLSNIADRYRMQGHAELLVHDTSGFFEVRLPLLKNLKP